MPANFTNKHIELEMDHDNGTARLKRWEELPVAYTTLFGGRLPISQVKLSEPDVVVFLDPKRDGLTHPL
jgi:hypothetical protein